MDNKSLPPLPASDSGALQRNQYDGFYNVKTREFWGQNEVTQNEVKPFQKCDHYFVENPEGVECKNCHAGWIGNLKSKDGKLIVNGETVSIS